MTTNIKKAIDYYKQLKYEEKIKKQFLSAKTDWQFFENLIEKCNENPNLKIEITLKDGTFIRMKTTFDEPNKPNIYSGSYIEEIN